MTEADPVLRFCMMQVTCRVTKSLKYRAGQCQRKLAAGREGVLLRMTSTGVSLRWCGVHQKGVGAAEGAELMSRQSQAACV